MNPTDTRGPGSLQVPNAGTGLPALQSSPASQTDPAHAAVPVNDGSVLQVTLDQLSKLTLQYAQDPFEQSKEVERLKTAYLFKEFGRTIKVADK